MKRQHLPFVLAALGAALVGSAAVPLMERYESAESFSLLNSPTIEELQEAAKGKIANTGVNRIPAYKEDWEDTDTLTYFCAAQTFKGANNLNDVNGGQINTYEVGVIREGDKVTITNMFNLYNPDDWSPAAEVPIEGTYDEDAKTITIPTLPSFNGTVIATISGYYVGVLLSGNVDDNFTFTTDDELVLYVEGDLERIYSEQAIAIGLYPPDGSYSAGLYMPLRNYSINKPIDGPKVICFNNEIDFGNSYSDYPISRSINVVNIGSQEAEYVVTVDSEGDSFYIEEPGGSIPAQSVMPLEFIFKQKETGSYEGLAMIDCEGNDDSIMVQFEGNINEMPDFGEVVTNGDFTWDTSPECPFELTKRSGKTMAYSGNHGHVGTTSEINFYFNVPEGQMGTVTYKGLLANSGGWRGCIAGMYVDDLNTIYAIWQNDGTNISNEEGIEFAPGDHYIRFRCEQPYYDSQDGDGLYVYDVNLELEALPASAAELVKDEVDFGCAIIKGGKVDKLGYVDIQNRGNNPLKYISSISSNEAFEVVADNGPVGTLENLTLSVKMNATIAGNYDSRINIKTSAGDFMVHVRARIYDEPDYSKIVTMGADHITFGYDPNYPFIIDEERGVAYNENAGIPTNEYTVSYFSMDFDVPENEVGYISWDGFQDGTPCDPDHSYGYINYGSVMFEHDLLTPTGNIGGEHSYWGDNLDASSSALEDLWVEQLVCLPGHHRVTFRYYKMGNGQVYGRDIFEISNFRLKLGETPSDGVELLTEKVDFEPIFVGPQRRAIGKATLRNIGSNLLEIYENKDNTGAFSYAPTDAQIDFNNTVDVTLYYEPTQEGDIEEDLVIKTSGGDVTVKCVGHGKSQEGILYPGDFEDEAYGWEFFDINNDGYNWNMGTESWGAVDNYSHAGHDCLVSHSNGNRMGKIEPDNVAASPAIEVPANGATLSFFVAAFAYDVYEENYSVYVTEDISDIDKVLQSTPLLTETIDEPALPKPDTEYIDGWMERTIDLGAYAGKKIYVLFRHHDCFGQYILRLDDMFVLEGSGVENIYSDHAGDVASQEIFDVNGIQLPEMQNGLNIVRTTFCDGRTITSKVMIKK